MTNKISEKLNLKKSQCKIRIRNGECRKIRKEDKNNAEDEK